MENAVIVWPDGNENLSGGSTFDQQCGSIWQGRPRSPDGGKTLRSPISKQHQTQAVPDPAVAHARRGDHPDAKPARRAPAIHPPHQPVIATVNVSPEVACDCHRFTSPTQPETHMHSQ